MDKRSLDRSIRPIVQHECPAERAGTVVIERVFPHFE
jgi:hypothetical protein